MYRYYYNTTANNPNNYIFGYIDTTGGLVGEKELEESRKYDPDNRAICAVFLEKEWLVAIPLNQFKQQIQDAACNFLKQKGVKF